MQLMRARERGKMNGCALQQQKQKKGRIKCIQKCWKWTKKKSRVCQKQLKQSKSKKKNVRSADDGRQ